MVRAGTYGAPGAVTSLAASGTASAPITVMGYPGDPKPTILGQFRIAGSYDTVQGFDFQGPTGSIANGTCGGTCDQDVLVWISPQVSPFDPLTNVVFTENVVQGDLGHAGVYLWHVNNTQVTRNYVHDNGNFGDPSQANLDHGIYWDSGSGGVIGGNVIEHNLAWGVQLYPSVTGILVTQNTITLNQKGGVIVANSASRNMIADNIIANNYEGVRTWSLTGTGNTAQDNLFWNNPNGNHSTAQGIGFTGDIVADPRFVSNSNYHLQPGSPAISSAAPQFSQPTDMDGVPRGSAPSLGAYQSR